MATTIENVIIEKRCGSCYGGNVQLLGACMWDIDSQQWILDTCQPPQSDFWCVDCQDEVVVKDIEVITRTLYIDGLGDLIETAEANGWVDTFGDASTGWDDRDADAAEEAAEAHLIAKGFIISYEEPPEE